jgi:hypothetical protein
MIRDSCNIKIVQDLFENLLFGIMYMCSAKIKKKRESRMEWMMDR